MIKFYKVVRRNSDDIHLPDTVLEKIIESEKQLIKVMQEDGESRLINKSDIVDAYFDKEYSEAKSKEKIDKQYDRYLDKKTRIVKLIERGTLSENIEQYEKL